MYGKIKYWLLLSLIIILGGCSAFRKGRSAEISGGPGALNLNSVVTTVYGYNIAGRGFEIRKGTIELESTEFDGRFGLNAKLNNRGDFIASVRGPLGIELVRILMVGNDIAAIDRINKTVYTGRKAEFLKKNGMPEDFLNILVGDMPSETEGNFRIEHDNMVTVSTQYEAFTRVISICLDEMKICSENIESAGTGHNISMNFGNFIMTGDIKYPARIEMREKSGMFHVKLSISDLIYGYDSDIPFNLPEYKRESL